MGWALFYFLLGWVRLMALACIVTLSCVPSTEGGGWNLVPLLKKLTFKIIKHRMLVDASLRNFLEHASLHATYEVVLKYSLPSSSFTLSPRFGGSYSFSALAPSPWPWIWQCKASMHDLEYLSASTKMSWLMKPSWYKYMVVTTY